MEHDLDRLLHLAAADPGSDEAIAAATDHLSRCEEPAVAEAVQQILHAWGRRLYLASGAHRHTRGSESHEARIQQATSWVWEKLAVWRPNPDGSRRGSPAAYLNSIKQRLPGDLYVSTGTAIDLDRKARKVLAAARSVQARAQAEGRHLDMQELTERTRAALIDGIRTRNMALTDQELAERLRKDGLAAWLTDLEVLLAQNGSVEEESAVLAAPEDREDGEALTAELIEDLIAEDRGAQRRQRLCAPHLQYLVRNWKN